MISLRSLPRLATLSRFALLAGLLAQPVSLLAQERVQEVTEGHGGIEGAPVRPVQSLDLHPGQVQTINLHPRYHMIIEFPYQVARIDAGDPDVFMAEILGNKVTLKATKVTRTETSMSIVLADANMTVVPYLIRADSTQPIVYVLRYTDPISKHLNAQEAAIAAQVQQNNAQAVDILAEERLRQRLLLASNVVRVDKDASVGRAGEKLVLNIETAQEIPNPEGTPELYLRYRVLNQSAVPLTDLRFVARVVERRRRWIFFTSTTEREIFDIRDVRSAVNIPAGAAASGILILDALDLNDNESLSIEAIGFNGQRVVRMDRVLVGG